MYEGTNAKFGLIIPKKVKVSLGKSALEQGDSDESDRTSTFNLSDQSKSKTFLRKQTQLHIESALTQDANIFDYDASYEDDKRRRVEKEEERFKEVCQASKPKYMGGLLRQAEERKKEKMMRVERKVAKERRQEEAEGLFLDKERYETEAYKESRKKMQEEQRLREEALKEAQPGDFSGFYKHLFDQKTTSAAEVADDNDAEHAKQNNRWALRDMKKSERKESGERVSRSMQPPDAEVLRGEGGNRDDRRKVENDRSIRRKNENDRKDKREQNDRSEEREGERRRERRKEGEVETRHTKVLPCKHTSDVLKVRERYLQRKKQCIPP